MTIDRRISLNSLSTASWTLEQDLDLCARLGVQTVSLFLSKLGDGSVALVGDAGLAVSQVFTKGMTLHDESRWPAEREYLLSGVETAAALGAPWLGLTSGAAGDLEWDAAVDALGRALAPVVAAGRSHGVGVTVEHTLPTRVEVGFIQSLADCVDVARQLGLGATMECNYCFRERGLGATISAAIADGLLAAVQVSDLVPPSTTVPDRAAIAFEVEILGPRVEAEGYEPVVRRSIERLDAMLTGR